jgi:hypothetical protein
MFNEHEPRPQEPEYERKQRKPVIIRRPGEYTVGVWFPESSGAALKNASGSIAASSGWIFAGITYSYRLKGFLNMRRKQASCMVLQRWYLATGFAARAVGDINY